MHNEGSTDIFVMPFIFMVFDMILFQWLCHISLEA